MSSRIEAQSISTILKSIDEMTTSKIEWSDGTTITLSSFVIKRAKEWIEQFYDLITSCTSPWVEPNITASGWGDIVFTWRYEKRTFEVIIDTDPEEDIWYLKVWGPNVNTEMEDGELSGDISECLPLWGWLYKGYIEKGE